jgi:hypothetical protein
MNTQRENLYKAIHKGLRAILSRLADEAGRADLADPADLRRLRELAAATFGMLEDDAAHEDRFVSPLLRSCAPDVAERLDAAHRELEHAAAALARALAQVSPSDGHAFLLALSRYHAAQLSHMADEEELAQPALWRAYGDETLRQVQDQIVASIPPEKMAPAMAAVLPALNPVERAGMLGGIQAHAPAPAFQAILGVASRALDPASFARLQRDLSQSRAA